MSDQDTASNPFEAIKHTTDDGAEYWSARDLAEVLGYASWQNFHTAIKRAMTACESSGYAVSDHFNDTIKLIESGKGAKRKRILSGGR